MDSTQNQKWLIFLFFSGIGILIIYLIATIVYTRTDKTYSTQLENARLGPGSSLHGEKIHLVKDKPVIIGKMRMMYRGRDSGMLLLDLVFLELDPHYTYSRKIALKEAKTGFRISNRRFMVTSIKDERLKIVMGPSQQ